MNGTFLISLFVPSIRNGQQCPWM